MSPVTVERRKPETGSRSRFVRRLFRNRLAGVALLTIVVIVVFAVFAPALAPFDPVRGDMRSRLQPPGPEHVFGTDQQGRDLWSRTIWGARVALQVGFVSVAIGLFGGVLLGLLAGFGSRTVDSVIMRFVDVLLSFPYILLVIGVVSVLGPDLRNAMIAIGISTMPDFARLVRSVVLTIREQEFVHAVRALGGREERILLRHILPNCAAPITVQATLALARAILAEASLSFLGLGIQPPTPSWGSMIAIGREYLMTHPYMSIIPGVAIMILILALNIIGDALRDVLDPKIQ